MAKNQDYSLFWADPGSAEAAPVPKNERRWLVAPHETSTTAQYHIIISNLQKSYSPPEKANIDSVRAILTHGLQRDAFTRLKEILHASNDQLSDVVRIPFRTIARRSLFKPDESERILRVATAFQRAIEVLGTLEKARRWFASPKKALGEKTPMEFCDTEPGAREVVNLLGRIEHGVFT